jgi:cytochrome c oxidase accessory protein FixG
MRLLPTLDAQGGRRWVRPRLSKGRFLDRRRAVGWTLMGLFLLLPHVQLAGKPALLLDVAALRFTVLGATFAPTDTSVLMLFLLAAFVGVFLLTALWGRVWCGWACPQTVWLELLFRPIERLIEGSPQEQRALDRDGPDLRRAVKHIVFMVLAFVLGNTFLAYFVGAGQLGQWMRSSPVEHPAAFAVMAVTTLLVFMDFAWFREQTCLVACPYGRFQSVLLDRHSLAVGFDRARGEPRGKPGRTTGDCIDCSACVSTCPTGIDIRDGLQMECVNCTQCIDACDAIMDRVGKPRGLIRHASEAELAGEPRRLLRPRVLAYAAVLGGLLLALGTTLALRRPAEVTLLRSTGVPFIDRGGQVEVHVRVKIHNRSDGARAYSVRSDDPGVSLNAAAPLALDADAAGTLSLTLLVDRGRFTAGRALAHLLVDDGRGFREVVETALAGPMGGR